MGALALATKFMAVKYNVVFFVLGFAHLHFCMCVYLYIVGFHNNACSNFLSS
jgi:hypothetical protein